jgi:hypothetical protein
MLMSAGEQANRRKEAMKTFRLQVSRMDGTIREVEEDEWGALIFTLDQARQEANHLIDRDSTVLGVDIEMVQIIQTVAVVETIIPVAS